ncbi:MAG TPA: formyltetrahydrofolate deformylase [Oceanipulchritudo sp.]|nr:formyltetrahydrofolate deformylase [Oceanipulchritudo sp.]
MEPETPAKPTLIALLHGPDQPGLVAKTANWIYQRKGNILHADQHRDDEAGIFFQRIEWEAAESSGADAKGFATFVEDLGMKVSMARSDELPRVALFVSKIEHCFVDLLARWKMGELPCELACVISNHPDLAAITEFYGIPFHHIPVRKGAKQEAERQQVSLLRDYKIDLVVMARYMQVLSNEFLSDCGAPVINIHHSFLPAFAGAKPYHQAHSRGVKLIGATAHYATAILDDGPIIQQDVSPVNHRHSVRDLVRKGRDLEKSVLAQAVRWHLEHRVLVYANKTVVFD